MHLPSSVQLQNIGVYGSTTQCTQNYLMPSYVWPGIQKYMESPGLICWYPFIFLLPFSRIIASALKAQLDLAVTVTTQYNLFQLQTSTHLHLAFHHGCLSKLLSLLRSCLRSCTLWMGDPHNKDISNLYTPYRLAWYLTARPRSLTSQPPGCGQPEARM